ncbi:MAG: transcription antitermination factor NusB [Treponema sp.]|nr:transcription antitermination factor NusB [Treponema sp.]
MSRRKARILAVQALYSYEMGGADLDSLLTLDWEKKEPAAGSSAENSDWNDGEKNVEQYDFARILISGTINHIDEIDSVIKAHLSEKWDFDRVNKVSIAVLRVGVFSLMFQSDDIPPTIVIDEAIGIAKEYGADDSFKFINAVLDNIRKDLEREKQK